MEGVARGDVDAAKLSGGQPTAALDTNRAVLVRARPRQELDGNGSLPAAAVPVDAEPGRRWRATSGSAPPSRASTAPGAVTG